MWNPVRKFAATLTIGDNLAPVCIPLGVYKKVRGMKNSCHKNA
jgi:hypothetical protein